ncbi:uncharacterized protein LOC119179212 isoform X1 [Rhipicephalus microplus]|uniref:uncharacterized protein LOC119179212 isoform X1 n=2 Tax=Rhipicephalus microplus TaxID=6941 RepID=UPI003F6B32DC
MGAQIASRRLLGSLFTYKMMAKQVLTFSPPTKPVEGEAVVETLLLQPFAKPPQVTFENVVANRDAVRQLRILNTTSAEQRVMLGVPRGKGFTSDTETFTVRPGQSQMVTFTWKPDEKATAARVAVSVSTDKGVRSQFVLLGTVRQEVHLRINKKGVPRSSILTTSQKPNQTPGPAKKDMPKKVAPNAAQPTRKPTGPPRITVPVEFKTRPKKRTGCENTRNTTTQPTAPVRQASSSSSACGARPKANSQRYCPPRRTAQNKPTSNACPRNRAAQAGVSLASDPTPKPEEEKPPTEAVSSEGIRRETFSGGFDILETMSPSSEGSHSRVEAVQAQQPLPTAGALVDRFLPNESGDSKIQGDMPCTGANSHLQATVNATFEDSLEPRSAAFEDSLKVEAKDSAKDSANLNDAICIVEESGLAQNDTFELDLSARMEMLYQQIIEKQHSSGARENTADSAGQEQLDTSAYLLSLYNELCESKSKALLCSPSLVDKAFPEAMLQERRCSSPKLPENSGQDNSLEDLIQRLELDACDNPLRRVTQTRNEGASFDEHACIEDSLSADLSGILGKPGNAS